LQDEEYIEIVKDCIAKVIGQYKTEDNENMFDIKFSIDDQLFWETLKIMLRGIHVYLFISGLSSRKRVN
jgi:hypothetical protein